VAKEKDYLAIARKKVIRPAEVESLPKLLVYGRNKKGKSTFALSAGIENTLMVDCEKGAETMKSKNPYVWPITRWEDMNDCYWALRTGELSPKTLGQGKSDKPFTWVSLDTTTKLNNMALRYIMRKAEEADLDRRPGMVDRRDYNKSGELMKDMLNNFFSLPMGVVFTAQERMMSMDSGDSDEDEETTFFVPDLPAGVRGAVNSLVDCIARIYVVRIELKNGKLKAQRRLQIGVHERYDTGYRSDYVLPDVIKNPTIPKLVSLMHTGELPSK
jgi:hypothetical protein